VDGDYANAVEKLNGSCKSTLLETIESIDG
jgi:hypothetical protein